MNAILDMPTNHGHSLLPRICGASNRAEKRCKYVLEAGFIRSHNETGKAGIGQSPRTQPVRANRCRDQGPSAVSGRGLDCSEGIGLQREGNLARSFALAAVVHSGGPTYGKDTGPADRTPESVDS